MAYSLTNAAVNSPASVRGAAPREEDFAARRTPRGLIEAFIAVQFLWGVLLFLPGAQGYRAYVRALPYVASLLLFAFYYGGRRHYRAPAATKFLVLVMLLLGFNLFHPETYLLVGAAQVVFQFSIVAPAFWAGKAVMGPRLLNRMLWLIFVVSALNALVGLLQIYLPEYFMPPEFSTLAQSMNREIVEALSYEGAGGQKIIRPPGLSDMPGGAAVAGMMTAVMGIIFGMRREWRLRTRALCLLASAVGMVTLYLTQVRTFFLMILVAIAALCVVVIRRGQRWEAMWVAVVSIALIAASFAWALTIGGDSLSERFLGLAESGLVNSVHINRGVFLQQTLTELLFEYPLGAGLGRWGMMSVYFGDALSSESRNIWVEIQMTGWLLDGGVLMWLFYGGAIAASLLYTYRQAVSSHDREMVYAARVVLCFNLIIAGSSFAGPAFNTQLGIQFWFLSAALYGAGAGLRRMNRARAAAAARQIPKD